MMHGTTNLKFTLNHLHCLLWWRSISEVCVKILLGCRLLITASLLNLKFSPWLKPSRRSGVWRTKSTWNLAVCRLMISKHENNRVYICWNNLHVPDWKLSGWSSDCTADGEMEGLVERERWYSIALLQLKPLYNNSRISLTFEHCQLVRVILA
jgi:hypothetical protein